MLLCDMKRYVLSLSSEPVDFLAMAGDAGLMVPFLSLYILIAKR